MSLKHRKKTRYFPITIQKSLIVYLEILSNIMTLLVVRLSSRSKEIPKVYIRDHT